MPTSTQRDLATVHTCRMMAVLMALTLFVYFFIARRFRYKTVCCGSKASMGVSIVVRLPLLGYTRATGAASHRGQSEAWQQANIYIRYTRLAWQRQWHPRVAGQSACVRAAVCCLCASTSRPRRVVCRGRRTHIMPPPLPPAPL